MEEKRRENRWGKAVLEEKAALGEYDRNREM